MMLDGPAKDTKPSSDVNMHGGDDDGAPTQPAQEDIDEGLDEINDLLNDLMTPPAEEGSAPQAEDTEDDMVMMI